jgi:hypothetical protein
MIKRLWHLIIGHEWTEERAYLGPSRSGRQTLWIVSDYHECYGFTEIHRQCECGARDDFKLTGDFTAYPPSSDVKELKRMARL